MSTTIRVHGGPFKKPQHFDTARIIIFVGETNTGKTFAARELAYSPVEPTGGIAHELETAYFRSLVAKVDPLFLARAIGLRLEEDCFRSIYGGPALPVLQLPQSSQHFLNLLASLMHNVEENTPVHLIYPEAGLHPMALHAFADLLFILIDDGLRVIIETHSVDLVESFCSALDHGAIGDEDVRVYEFQHSSEGSVIRFVAPGEDNPLARNWDRVTLEKIKVLTSGARGEDHGQVQSAH